MQWNLLRSYCRPGKQPARPRPGRPFPVYRARLGVEEFEPRVVPSGVPAVPLGANIDAVRDWSLSNVFVDTIKQGRPFTSLSRPGSPAAVDANGWPTEDFEVIVQTGIPNTAKVYNGAYKLSFAGRADVSTAFTEGGSVSNLAYDPATNTTTADVTLNASDADSWYFALHFTNTNGGVQNVRLIRPGYAANTTQVFTNDFLNEIAPFGTLRFMDFTNTNNNQAVNWGDRSHVTDAEQSGDKGVAWEYVIQLANVTHKDIWINVPGNATDDYVTQLATLLKNGLDPGINVYVEYSNELWNGGFTQTQANKAAAVAEVEAGLASGHPSNLMYPGETARNRDGSWVSQWDWAWRRIARRDVEISNDFASVWGSGAIDNRIRPVLASQIANPYLLQTGLDFIQNTYGAPNHFLYGVAGAPYFNLNGQDSQTNLSVDQVLSAMSDSITQVEQWYPAYAHWATYYGLQDLAYEGGPDTFGPNNVAAKKAAALDPRMKDLVIRYLDDWYAQGGGLFNWYFAGTTSYDTPFGTWGLTNDITNLNTPKIQGINAVLAGPAPALAAGTPVPGEIPATHYAGAPTTSDPYLRWLHNGATLDYVIRAPQAGTYHLVVNYAANNPGGQLQVLLNDSAVRTLTLPATGPDHDDLWAPNDFAASQAVSLNLNQGLNVVRLKVIAEGYTLKSLEFTTDNSVTPPTVASAASAGSGVVAGTTAALSVLGADAGGESSLTYTWSSSGPAPVAFSANGTNGAKNATATFAKAGAYTLTATIRNAAGLPATSSVAVTVAQTLTAVAVSPGTASVANGAAQQFAATATDQFGAPLAVQPSFAWSVSGTGSGGSVSGGGLYTAPASGTPTDTVTAGAGGISGSATVTVTAIPPGQPNYANGFTASGLQLNGNAALTGTRLRLTSGGTWQGGSAFSTTRQNVTRFDTHFSFQLTDPVADGFAFVIQGYNPYMLGGFAGGLGYAGITRSVAVKFDLHDDAGEGPDSTGLYTNGAEPDAGGVDLRGTGIDLHSGHAFGVAMSYDGTTLSVTITDTVTHASATQSYAVDIPGQVGSSTAYVGFTGSTGGLAATQDILNWTFASR